MRERSLATLAGLLAKGNGEGTEHQWTLSEAVPHPSPRYLRHGVRHLKRLGFATAVAYAAPTILHLDRSAKAQILPSCINPPGVPPNPGCQGPDPANFSQPADGPVLDGSSGGGQ